MKTKEDIEKRLKKLRLRYAHKYIQNSQERKHLNCVFNEVHQTSALSYARTQAIEMPVAPKEQATIVVFQNKNDGLTHLCMYESNDAKNWQGLTCDSDEVSSSCSMFKPRTNVQDAKQEFLNLLVDDEYVFDNYRDVATLQWVLGERIHDVPLSLLDRLSIWVRSLFIRVPKPITKNLLSLSDDLWND